MIKYPNGKAFEQEVKQERKNKKSSEEISLSAANRGMNLESDINLSLDYYREKDIALIYKRPTPINVVKVDYSKGSPRITHAYFEKQSTTDYNGVYKGRYIDFEAKSTMNKTSFPLANIENHQIQHLKNVLTNGGIAFFIIQFTQFNEVYLLDASFVIDFYEKGDRKSIPYKTVSSNGVLLVENYNPRLDYISAVEKLYFSN